MEEENNFLPQKNIYCITLHNMKVKNDVENLENIQKSLNFFETSEKESLARNYFYKIKE